VFGWQTKKSTNKVATALILLMGMALLACGGAERERAAAVETAREETRAEIEAILTADRRGRWARPVG